jgi:hypothetical protein
MTTGQGREEQRGPIKTVPSNKTQFGPPFPRCDPGSENPNRITPAKHNPGILLTAHVLQRPANDVSLTWDGMWSAKTYHQPLPRKSQRWDTLTKQGLTG